MLIALDYDDTYTKDPELWQQFINIAHKKEHTVICAIMRHEFEHVDMCEILKNRVKIVFTCRKQKREFLQSLGIYPDIWIDDMPEFIVANIPIIGES